MFCWFSICDIVIFLLRRCFYYDYVLIRRHIIILKYDYKETQVSYFDHRSNNMILQEFIDVT